MEILRKESSILDFSEEKLESYKITFNGRGLDPSGKIIDVHELSLSFPMEYPRRVPEIRWLTPILHPNISGGRPCLGNFQMNPGVKLVEIVEILWDMARLAMFNVYGGYGEQVSSFRSVTKKVALPVDGRILRDKTGRTAEEKQPEGDEDIMFIGSSRLSGDNDSEYGAGLLIYNPETGKVLLLRRSQDSSYPGYWDFAGGHVEYRENILEAAIREGEEELGTLPQVKIDTAPYWTKPGAGFAFASFLAFLEPEGQSWEPTINFEHDEWGWFDPRDLPDPVLPGVLKAMKALLLKAS